VLVRFSPVFSQHFEHVGDGFADVRLELVDGFALGVATGQCGDFGPVAAAGVFVNDNGVRPHEFILAQAQAWPCQPPRGRFRLRAARWGPVAESALFECYGEAVALHVEDGFEVGVGGDGFDVIGDHVDVVSEDEAAGADEGE
jgi:hypothetical protein